MVKDVNDFDLLILTILCEIFTRHLLIACLAELGLDLFDFKSHCSCVTVNFFTLHEINEIYIYIYIYNPKH